MALLDDLLRVWDHFRISGSLVSSLSAVGTPEAVKAIKLAARLVETSDPDWREKTIAIAVRSTESQKDTL